MVTNDPEVSIIIPAHREATNLSKLVPRLAAALCQDDMKGEIIVVDDFSDDGTEAICAALSQHFPVRLLSRFEERGLSSAVVLGFGAARGNILVVMDADMSHPAEMVPILVEACRSPFTDLVIGSRYVDGGSVDDSWPWYRWLNSRVAMLFARGLTAARDPLSGFFAIKTSTLQTATELRPLGYKIGLEIIVRCNCRRIVEVPIAFHEREFGESKLTLRQQWEYIRQLALLYSVKYPGYRQGILFGSVGLSGTVVDLVCFTLLLLWAPLWLSRVTAIAIATIWNFAWNRRFTFQVPSDVPILRQLILYAWTTLLGATINLSLTLLLCSQSRLLQAVPVVSASIGTLAGAIANYILCRRWVFSNRRTMCDVSSQPPDKPLSSEQRRRVA